MLKRGIPTASLDLMMASLAKNTLSQYNSSLKSWWQFCEDNNLDFLEVHIPQIVLFFTQKFNEGASYSTINTCRSALSLILGQNTTQCESVSRLIKGIYRMRPPKPKYDSTWDPNEVLKYLSNTFPYENVTLHDISLKTITLLAIASAQRMQTLSFIKTNNITINDESITIKIDDLIKTSKPGSCQPLIQLPFIRENPKICPALTIQNYLEKTKSLRGTYDDNHLFISFRKPYKKVTSQTLAHWVKKVLHLSGIDISIYGAHSTRHASTSAAHIAGINLEVVRKAAGWSDNSNIFLKYYKKEINQSTKNFVTALFTKDS